MKEKNIEGNNSEDIINFFIETKRKLKNKNISDKTFNDLYLQAELAYKNAKENISDENILNKITDNYEEIIRLKKIKNFVWIILILCLVIIGILAIFIANKMFYMGLGVSITALSIITFLYFNIDFKNIKKNIKNFKFKDTTENELCYAVCFIGIIIIVITGIFYFTDKNDEKLGYKNYYDKNAKKYNVTIESDFKDNLLFNKCDITLNIYDSMGVYEHGKNKSFTIMLPIGIHKLEFSGNNDLEIIKLKVNGDTTVKYKLECLSGGIYVKEISKTNK